jgi:hypothetical protein
MLQEETRNVVLKNTAQMCILRCINSASNTNSVLASEGKPPPTISTTTTGRRLPSELPVQGTFGNIHGRFEHIQGTFREHSDTFRELSGNILTHSGNIQGPPYRQDHGGVVSVLEPFAMFGHFDVKPDLMAAGAVPRGDVDRLCQAGAVHLPTRCLLVNIQTHSSDYSPKYTLSNLHTDGEHTFHSLSIESPESVYSLSKLYTDYSPTNTLSKLHTGGEHTFNPLYGWGSGRTARGASCHFAAIRVKASFKPLND